MKKNPLSILAVICALLALVAALANLVALGRINEELTARLNTLQSQMDELRRDPEEMQGAMTTPEEEDMEAWCNLVVDDWSATESTLTADIFAVAQLEDALTVSQAQLQLICGEQSQVRDIEMRPGEGSDSYEANLPGFVFDLPEMEDGDELTLELIVTFTGARNIHARVHWYLEDGSLYLVSG